MFLGKFITSLSNNNRIVLPKKFRQDIQNSVIYLIMGFDGGIWGFNQEGWSVESQKRLSEDLTTVQGRVDRRDFFTKADSAMLDEQGRFVLSEEMVSAALLKDKIIILGTGDHFEIWDLETWSKLNH